MIRFLPLVLVACARDPYAPLEPDTSRAEWFSQRLRDQRELDVLLVIDNSPAMAAHRDTIVSNVPRLDEMVQGGNVDSVRYAAITTDLGAAGVDGCTQTGDAARFRRTPAFTGEFMERDRVTSNVTQGTFVEALAGLIDVGASGCAYTQPLAALRRALPDLQARVLRDEAGLAIVFITANDDCSFTDAAYAINSPSINAHACLRDAGLVSVAEIVKEVRALKPEGWQVLVSSIAGPATPLSVRLGPAGLERAPSCEIEQRSALPAVRIDEFLDAFTNRNFPSTLCGEALDFGIYYGGFDVPWSSTCIEATLVDAIPETP